MVIVYFNITENCGYKCSDYFEQLPKAGAIEIYGEESIGHLVIAGNEDAQQVKIYTPSSASKEVSVTNNGELKTTRTYCKTSKRAKQVKFSDFKQIDPILSRFKDLEEPEIPQTTCRINDVQDVIDPPIQVKEL